MESHIAEFVVAKSGKDIGDCYMVISEEDNYLFLSDGKRRKVSNPKKKKIKHVSFSGVTDEFILKRLTTTGKLTNKEVRYALSNFLGRLSNEK